MLLGLTNLFYSVFENISGIFFAGGRGQIKQKKKSVPQKVTIAKIPRAKKKYVTRVCGLQTFGKKNTSE